jgi:hypothetical protein
MTVKEWLIDEWETWLFNRQINWRNSWIYRLFHKEPPPPPKTPETLNIAADLAAVGIDVEDAWDINPAQTPNYRNAIPVLTQWLSKATEPQNLQSLAHALHHPSAKKLALKPLIDLFTDTASHPLEDKQWRWSVGDTIGTLWDDRYFDDLSSIVTDRSYGMERQMIVEGMGRSKLPAAVDVLISVLDDPEVEGHALSALRRLRTERARPYFDERLNHEIEWIRKEARVGLARLDGKRPVDVGVIDISGAVDIDELLDGTDMTEEELAAELADDI